MRPKVRGYCGEFERSSSVKWTIFLASLSTPTRPSTPSCPASALSRSEDLLKGGGTQDPLTPVQECLWVRRLDACYGVRGRVPKRMRNCRSSISASPSPSWRPSWWPSWRPSWWPSWRLLAFGGLLVAFLAAFFANAP